MMKGTRIMAVNLGKFTANNYGNRKNQHTKIEKLNLSFAQIQLFHYVK